MKPEKPRNPNYQGLISVHRISGSQLLFASPFRHQGFIMLRVHSAYVERRFSETKYYPRDLLAEIHLSYSQYAQMVSAPNVGFGSPCTLSYLAGEAYEKPTLQQERPLTGVELSDTQQAALDHLEALIKAISEERMTKAVRTRLLSLAQSALRELTDSLPYVAERYREYLDSLEQQAKTEVSSFCDMAVKQAGLDTIQSQNYLPPVN